jgi:hypothetical protein
VFVTINRSLGAQCAGKNAAGPVLSAHGPTALAAVAAVLGCEYQLLLEAVEIAFRPAVIVAVHELHDLLGRQLRTVLMLVEIDPVLRELVAAVLSHEQPTGGIEGKTLAVADTGCVTFLGGEPLSCLVGVIAPRAAVRLLFRTGQ